MEISVRIQPALLLLLLSVLNTLSAASHTYAMCKVLSANCSTRRREVMIHIVTASSNKLNGIMKLLKTKKDLDAIADSENHQDEVMRGGAILSVTLLFPRSGMKTFVCLRSPL